MIGLRIRVEKLIFATNLRVRKNSLNVFLGGSCSGRRHRLVVRFGGFLAVFLPVTAVASAAAVCPLPVSLSVSGARDAATGAHTSLATATGRRALVGQLHPNIRRLVVVLEF